MSEVDKQISTPAPMTALSAEARLFVALFALALLYHLLGPAILYKQSGWLLLGPMPAAFGAPIGYWLHRADARLVRRFATVAWAGIGCIAVMLLLGPLVVGPWRALLGVFRPIWGAIVTPFEWVDYLTLGAGLLTALWSMVKVGLIWAMLLYAAWQIQQHDMLRLVHPMLSRSPFLRQQRKLYREWMRACDVAVGAGQPPPPRPAELVLDNAHARSGSHPAQSLYWVLRIGLLIFGALSFWAVFDEQVKGLVKEIAYGLFWRDMFGGP